jgi:ABC-2 type transport system permease protein
MRSAPAASRTALYALLLRDLTVLRKHAIEFVMRTLIQPFLLVFVFLYVFPQIGQSIGGGRGATSFATVLIPGVVGITIMFHSPAAVSGVRLHPGDRGPGASPVASVVGGRG